VLLLFHWDDFIEGLKFANKTTARIGAIRTSYLTNMGTTGELWLNGGFLDLGHFLSVLLELFVGISGTKFVASARRSNFDGLRNHGRQLALPVLERWVR